MQTIITARHCEIPDALRERAGQLIDKVARVGHRPQRAEVIFDDDHNRKVVELRMHLPRGQVMTATGEADDFRSALDRAVEKLRPQLEKDAGRSSAKRRAATG